MPLCLLRTPTGITVGVVFLAGCIPLALALTDRHRPDLGRRVRGVVIGSLAIAVLVVVFVIRLPRH